VAISVLVECFPTYSDLTACKTSIRDALAAAISEAIAATPTRTAAALRPSDPIRVCELSPNSRSEASREALGSLPLDAIVESPAQL